MDENSIFVINVTNVTVDNSTTITPLNYAYLTLTCLMSSLSAIGSLLIIGTYFVYPHIQNQSRAMLVHLSVADFLMTVGNFLGIPEALDMTSKGYQTSTLCVISGTVATVSSISSFMWTSAIAVYLYICIAWPKSNRGTRSLVVCYAVCWFIPLAMAIIANVFNVFGYDPSLHQMSWCWISSSQPDQLLWQFITGKGWEIIAYFVTGVFYALIKCRVHSEMKKELPGSPNQRAIYRANRKMIFVPLVFILIRIWGTIRFLVGVVDHSYASSTASSWIVVMQGFGDSSQGFANCILFCFCTPKIRILFLTSLRKRCCCCRTTSKTGEFARGASVSYTSITQENINSSKEHERTPLLYN